MLTTRMVPADRGEFRAATLGTGSPVLLLHALSKRLEPHALIARRPAERHTVHAIDLPGHGESELDVARVIGGA